MTITANASLLASALIRAMALTVLCIASSAMAQLSPPEFSGRIDIRDVERSALLYALADTVNINLAAPVVPSGQRVSMTADFSSIDDLLQKLAKTVSMRGVLIGQRILVLSPCLHRDARNTPPRVTGPVTLRLPDATLREVVGQASQESPAKAWDEEPLLRRRLTVRLINVSRDDVFQSAFVAFGGELAADAGRNPSALATGHAECPGTATAPDSALQQRALALRQRTNHCPYRLAEDAKSCSPLEYFQLDQLVSRGYVESKGRRVAFVEAPDELLYAVHLGTRIGHNHGRAQEISRSEIKLEEIVLNRQDVWWKSASELRHWATRSAPPSR